RENGLAGDTTPMRAPGFTAGGFSRLKARGSGLQVPRHFVGDAAVLVAAQHLSKARPPSRRDRRREKTLLGPAVARKRVLRACVRDASNLDRMHERLEHLGLHLHITRALLAEGAADEHAVAAGGDGLNRGVRN